MTPVDTAVSTPLTARRGRPVAGPRPGAGRQVDLAPRADPGRARRSARPPSPGCWKARTCCIPPRPCARSAPGWSAAATASGASTASASAAFAQPAGPLDFGNSGTGCRLAIGAVAGCPITATFDGDASLRKRPMRRVLDPLGADGRARDRAGRRRPAAADAAGARDPIPIVYEPPVPSAQLKSAVLLAGLAAPGETTVIEAEATPRPHRAHAQAFRRQGHEQAARRARPPHHACTGQPELEPANVVVPADPSSAAFPLVAALIVPGSDLIARSGDDQSAAHRAVSRRCSEMGAKIETLADARRRRRGGRRSARARLARSRASTCRPSARRR